MSNAEKDERPRTIGELRRCPAEMGTTAAVDPQLSDDEPMAAWRNES